MKPCSISSQCLRTLTPKTACTIHCEKVCSVCLKDLPLWAIQDDFSAEKTITMYLAAPSSFNLVPRTELSILQNPLVCVQTFSPSKTASFIHISCYIYLARYDPFIMCRWLLTDNDCLSIKVIHQKLANEFRLQGTLFIFKLKKTCC